MHKILITGSSGFIGQALCKKLSVEHNKYDVYALYNHRFPNIIKEEHINSSSSAQYNNITPVQADITDKHPQSALYSLFDEHHFDVVIHLAAMMDFNPRNEQNMYRVNVEGTQNVLSAFKKQRNGPGELFVMVSSQEAMGPSSRTVGVTRPFDEDDECNPDYTYGKQKLIAEQWVRKQSEEGDKPEDRVPWCILRSTGVMGPNDSYAAFEMMKTVDLGAMIAYPGSCIAHTSFGHVDDIAEGIMCVLRNLNKAKNNIFIIGPPESISYKEFIDLLCEYLGRFKPRIIIPISIFKSLVIIIEPILNRILWIIRAEEHPNTQRKSMLFNPAAIDAMNTERRYSIKKAQQQLNYRPQYNMSYAIQQIVNNEVKSGRLYGKSKRQKIYGCMIIGIVFLILLSWMIIKLIL